MSSTISLRGTNQIQNEDDDCIACHITEVEAIFDVPGTEGADGAQYACHYDNPLGFRDSLSISLSQPTLNQYEALIQSGAANFCVPSKYQEGRLLVVPQDVLLKPDSRRRKLQSHKDYTVGTKRVLTVRVTSSSGEEPNETTEEIGRAIFGTNWDASTLSQPSVTVVEQYEAVSHGQLQLIQAVGNGISNGIIQVQLNETVSGKEIQRDLTSEILAATRAALGMDLSEVAEHFIFCLPNDSLLNGKDSWTAFTNLFEPYSYYQQSRCTKLSVVMHELGHSLGFRHSGYAGNEYADESGYMGYAINEFGYPIKAFNAHKHWVSGWFTDRAEEVYPENGPIVGNLVSFVDYGDSEMQTNDVVLMRAGNLYMHYNRAKGYNVDTPSAYKDRVVIAESTGDLELSNFVAALAKGQSYFYPNFSGYDTLVIEVCDQMTGSLDYAVVSMYIEDGIQKSNCGVSTLERQTASNTYPMNTTSLFNSTGPLSITEDISSSEKSKTNPVIGIVWGVVGILFLVALYLIYRLRRRQLSKAATRRVTKATSSKDQPRQDWIPSMIETPSKDDQDAESNGGSTDTPRTADASNPSTPTRGDVSDGSSI
ncbi:hypothetical protein MPSEU_000788400 [Mayamaea pseudoterrestris]|nr:hypothetical protein MPSEU_000788400 [Mayamaea pseudoterrestris]